MMRFLKMNDPIYDMQFKNFGITMETFMISHFLVDKIRLKLILLYVFPVFNPINTRTFLHN